MSPLLRSEIAKVDINNQKAEIIFKNTSYVKVVTATDNARGARANLVLVDEYRQMDEDIINMVLKKFLNLVRHPGFLNKPQYKHVIAALEKMNIKITPTIEMMIEAAVKEMDIQNEKINAELKKD